MSTGSSNAHSELRIGAVANGGPSDERHEVSFAVPQDPMTRPVAVIGAGTLGRRIALMFATRGGEVRIYDPSANARRDATEYVGSELPEVVQTVPSGTPGRVVTTDELASALPGAWLVIEAVPEKFELKLSVFAALKEAADPDAILTTNSSSYPSSSFASTLSAPERLLNAHFFMPPAQRAVELMTSGTTDSRVFELLRAVLPEYGLHPFVARRESMGFIFNRVWAAMKREVLQVVADGVAAPEDVDALWRMNTGLPTGIFEGMDQVGLDVVLDIEENYARAYPHLSEAPRQLLRTYVDAGHLGVKTGRGFYPYE
ncbi:3-hydroxyacyl-CoA dehydrogenase family protein [Streptomyces albus]|uniref:3-hydroxyacyl-CoA dehydrogenase family protein n=1 Tax=Streptomyces sp. NRRL F-5917 TaxID=1463873 RepID=UPI001F3C937F|nr:3-hydroxyacyl-CoA dehydrogenase family protein [Streptomyces sp. NRRL F-5917]